MSVYPGVVFVESSDTAYCASLNLIDPGFCETKSSGASKQTTIWYNLAKFTSRGYAVFLPSIPLPPGKIDISTEVTRNVVPGVEKLIQMGVTKRGHIGLSGYSWGSIAALFLLEQTNVFSAASTAASYVDLLAYHGFLHPETRYSPIADSYSRQNFAETEAPNGVLRIMKIPADDIDAYIRNSPLFSANRIKTPLFLIHGEFDWTPIEGAESLYSILRENGVPVQLVRYWGEDHIIESAANIRDVW